MRKDAGFEVADKIYLYYEGDETIEETMKAFGDDIKADTLSVSMENTVPEDSFAKTWNINDHQVKIGVKKVG